MAAAALAAAAALLIATGVGAGAARAGRYTITQCNFGGSGQRPLIPLLPSNPPFASYADSCQTSPSGQLGFQPDGGRMGGNETRGATFNSPDPAITIERVRLQYHSFASSQGAQAFLLLYSFGPGGRQLIGEGQMGDSTAGTSSDVRVGDGTTGFAVDVYCSTGGGTYCQWSDPTRVLDVTGMQEVASESVPPTASISGGTLLSPGTRRGDETLAYSASDGQSGVARVTASLGGTPVGTDDFTHDPGRCPFTSWRACPASVASNSMVIHTNLVDDGTYSVLLTAYDAAGNQVSTQRDNITVSNVPRFIAPPTISGAAQVGRAALAATDGQADGLSKDGSGPRIGRSWFRCDAEGNLCQPIADAGASTYAPTAADVGHRLRVADVAVNDHGTAVSSSEPTAIVLDASGNAPFNGHNASPDATLVLAVKHPHRLQSAPYLRSGVPLAGRLTTRAGAPIGDAVIEVLQEPEIEGAPFAPAAATRTNADGTCGVRLPPGPARQVRVVYRYVVGDPEYVAHVDFEQRVGAGVVLEATRRLHNGQTIHFHGHLLGGYVPPSGKLVELQVLIGRSWQDFKGVRSGPDGRFEARRRLTRTSGHVLYAFRAAVRREAGYPFYVGFSRPRVVAVN